MCVCVCVCVCVCECTAAPAAGREWKVEKWARGANSRSSSDGRGACASRGRYRGSAQALLAGTHSQSQLTPTFRILKSQLTTETGNSQKSAHYHICINTEALHKRCLQAHILKQLNSSLCILTSQLTTKTWNSQKSAHFHICLDAKPLYKRCVQAQILRYQLITIFRILTSQLTPTQEILKCQLTPTRRIFENQLTTEKGNSQK